MSPNEFTAVLERQFAHMHQTLNSKAKEYAGDEDRLHNFKKAAAFLGKTPEQALLGMMAKHLVSVSDMVDSDEHYDEAVWDEKIGDSINYFVLLRALIFERAQKLEAELTQNMPDPHSEPIPSSR